MHDRSKVERFFEACPQSHQVFTDVISGEVEGFDGSALVDEHMNHMIRWVFARIEEEIDPESMSEADALHYIRELSVFARYNSQFLKQAADSVEGHVFELAHEFRRNHLEEGGERGKLPAHYVLYTSSLIRDLGVMVNHHVPGAATQMLVFLHHVLVNSHCPSTICGAYYATEAVAIDETLLLQRITGRYGHLRAAKTADELPNLKHYYELHLDEDHDAAMTPGGVEQGHMEGIARFIRQHDEFSLELRQVCDGFLQMLGAMAAWWTELAATAPSRAIHHRADAG